jgi:hypothetical protein
MAWHKVPGRAKPIAKPERNRIRLPHMDFAAWLKTQPKGALTRLWRESGVSWHTVNRAKRHKVGLKMAVLISRATGGEVSVSALTDDNVLDEPEPRRVA